MCTKSCKRDRTAATVPSVSHPVDRTLYTVGRLGVQHAQLLANQITPKPRVPNLDYDITTTGNQIQTSNTWP